MELDRARRLWRLSAMGLKPISCLLSTLLVLDSRATATGKQAASSHEGGTTPLTVVQWNVADFNPGGVSQEKSRALSTHEIADSLLSFTGGGIGDSADVFTLVR